MSNSLQSQTSIFNKLLAETLKKSNEQSFDDICLITNEPLLSDHIKLNCGHTFNYKPIFCEVIEQKNKMTYLETQRLKNNQIKCPYCRNIQTGILPYRNNMEKIKYVNWPINMAYKPYKCSYIFLSGKKKNLQCGASCSHEKYCSKHLKMMENREKKQKEKENIKKQKNNFNNDTLLKSIPFDSYFIKCVFELNKWKATHENNTIPTLHKTKTKFYFRHKCQHIINKGKKNEKCCSHYVKCSKVISNHSKQSITPIFYKQYLCHKHNKMTNHEKQNNIIIYPKNIKIDLNNIPDEYLINEQTFNLFLAKFYNNYFNSSFLYTYDRFIGFNKKMIEENNIIETLETLTNLFII